MDAAGRASAAQPSIWLLGRAAAMVCALGCGTTGSGPPPPAATSGAESESTCPEQFPAPDSRSGFIEFTTTPESSANVNLSQVYVQGPYVDEDDWRTGVRTKEFAEFINAQFPGALLVLSVGRLDLNEHGELQEDYFKALPHLEVGVELGVRLDPAQFRDEAALLAGFQTVQKAAGAAVAGRTLSRLVYPHGGRELSPKAIASIKSQGVDVAILGGPEVTAPGTAPPYVRMVETFAMSTRSWWDAKHWYLVDGPQNGRSVCVDLNATCVPAGSKSIYQLCAPDQAGAIAGYLAAQHAAPVEGSLERVEFIFSFNSHTGCTNPTAAPSGWSPAEYKEFTNSFAKMLATHTRPGMTTGDITVGVWGMSKRYAEDCWTTPQPNCGFQCPSR